MKPFKNILVTPLKKLARGELAVPIVERLKGIAFLVDHSSLLVPSHCGQYFGKRIAELGWFDLSALNLEQGT